MTGPYHIHLDAVGGIAGDMFVAALLDAFPELGERVFADLAKVLPKDAGRPLLAEGSSGAVRCLRFGLEAIEAHGHHHGHSHHQGHDHHHHTRYRDLVARIEGSGLSEGTAAQAGAILRHIAEAEAHIHGVALDEVHFHELADWDSLMDVVAAGSIAAALAGARWSVSELPRGGGMVRTQHGLLPVPAPATAEILKGFAWRDDGISGERVTPTGAAILRHLVTGSGKAEGRLAASGTGAGTRDLPGMPNILRVLAFVPAASVSHDRVAVLSFDIDDMTGEEIGVAADRLRAVEGVRDLAISSLIGKKGRPMHGFRLLVAPDALDVVKARCLNETSTIGLRWHYEERDLLERRGETVRDGDTSVRVKRVRRRPGGVTAKVESDDLAALGSLAERRAVKERLEGGET